MNYRFFSFITILFLLTSTNVNATYLAGGEFHFEHLNGNDYIVSFYLYRDCSGINVPSSINVNMESTICGINTTLSLPKESGPIIVTTIPNHHTTCMGGFFQGYEKYIYSDTQTFTTQCSDWNFNWRGCCRNRGITNFVNPLGARMYIESTFDNTIVNNSPTYFIDPILYGNMGTNLSIALGGFDVDGDQLLFRLAASETTANTPIVFTNGLSAAQPLEILAGSTISFSSTTGQFDCVLPMGAQTATFDVIVEEWRNGQKIGEHRRSIQVSSINLAGSTITAPIMSNLSNGSIVDAHTMKYNSTTQPFSFTMRFNDQDLNDVLTHNALYSTLETVFPSAQVTSTNPNGNLNEIELHINIPNPRPTLFSIVIEENKYLQESFSYELKAANITDIFEIETNPTNVHIYPNPIAKRTTFEVDSDAYEKLELTVFGMTGQVVHIQTTSGTNLLEFNRGDLSGGIYSYQLKGDGATINSGLLQLK